MTTASAPRLLKWLAFVALLMMLALGWQLFNYRARQRDRQMRDSLLAQAVSIARTVSPENVGQLSFTLRDKTTPVFEELRGQLTAYGHAIRQRSIYTVAARDGKYVFGPENLAEDDPLASPPGTEYRMPPPELKVLFETGDALTVGPFEDEYGYFLSAFAPVLDPVDHHVVMAVGLDIPATQWRNELLLGRLVPFASAFLLFLGLTGGMWAIRRRSQLDAESQHRLRHLETAVTGFFSLALTVFLTWMVWSSEDYNQQRAFHDTAALNARGVAKAFGQVEAGLQDLALQCSLNPPLSVRVFDEYVRHTPLDSMCIPAAWVIERPSSKPRDPAWEARFTAPSSNETLTSRCRFAADPECADSIRRAMLTGRPTAVSIEHGRDAKSGGKILAFQPVVEARDSAKKRPASGVVLCAVDTQRLLEKALLSTHPSEDGAYVHLEDLRSMEHMHLARYPVPCIGHPECGDKGGTILTAIHPLFVFGQAYAVVTHQPRASLRVAGTTCITGLLLTSVLTGTIGILRNRHVAQEQMILQGNRRLQESEERYRQLFEGSQEALLILDPSTQRFIAGNPASLQLFGVADAAQLATMDPATLSPEFQPDGRSSASKVHDVCQAALKEGHIRFDWIHRRTNGNTFPATVLLTTVHAGGDTMIQATILDVTEQKKAEAALRMAAKEWEDSTTQLSAIFDHVQAGIMLIDRATHNIVSANAMAAHLCGTHRENLLGKLCHQFVCPALEGQCPVTDLHQTIDDSERTILRADGRKVPVLKRVVPLNIGGGAYLLESFVDISKQKQSEEYLRAIMDTIQAGVVVCEQDSQKIVDANPVAAELLGMTPADAIGRDWSACVPGSSPIQVLPLKHAAAGDCNLATKQGDSINVRMKQANVRIQDRRLSVHSFIDITDIQRLLTEQEVNIDLATQLLQFINAAPPRHIEVDGGHTLFVDSVSVPCRAVGGDHVFVRTLPGTAGQASRTVFSIKDQSGHEVNCVLRSIVTDLLHHLALSDNRATKLSDVIGHLNETLCHADIFQNDDYVTCCCVEIRHDTLQMEYASCGHPPMLLVRDREVRVLPDGDENLLNPPLAVLAETEFQAGRMQLKAGDLVLIYTDGLTEMPRRHRRCILTTEALTERVRTIVRQTPGIRVNPLIARLLREISELSAEEVIPGVSNSTEDDVTIVGIEVQPEIPAHETILHPSSIDDLSESILSLANAVSREWIEDGFRDAPFRARIVLEEAITNAWRHAHKEDPSLPIRVRWWSANDFVLEVTDQGPGFNPLAVPDSRDLERRLNESGRGMLLMQSMADEVRWTHGGRRVVASFSRPLHPKGSRKERHGLGGITWWAATGKNA